MVEVRRLAIDGPLEILPRRFADDRGWFSESWNAAAWREAGIDVDWVQDNHSLSRAAGTLRGLHFQAPPMAQAKLVRATKGRVFDVAVDIRRDSPDFGRWVAVELDAARGNQLYVPAGFAHGFLTLEEDCEVQYKCSALYSPEHDRAFAFDDLQFAIAWPIPGRPVQSARDAAAPVIADAGTPF